MKEHCNATGLAKLPKSQITVAKLRPATFFAIPTHLFDFNLRTQISSSLLMYVYMFLLVEKHISIDQSHYGSHCEISLTHTSGGNIDEDVSMSP